ncbi:MAG TPA: hypothetical protein VGU73_06930 [Acidimicrobiia bacterium]|nr:hypothetical protein [Acidimicrobiia bacterium]
MRARVTGGRAGALAAAAAIVATLLVGCGGGGGLDVAAVQRAITRKATLAYPTLGVASTRCASPTQNHLRCTVRTANLPLHIAVRTTRSGRLGLEAVDAVVPNASAAYLVGANASIPATVSCGPSGVTVATPGAALPCAVGFVDGTSEAVQVRILDAAGDARVETPAQTMLPPAATPGGSVTWSPLGRTALGRPLTFGAQADGVGLAWMDPQLLHPVLVAGTTDPANGPGTWGGQVPNPPRGALAAAFNSGFKMGDIRGGWVGWGATWRAPEAGDASLVVSSAGLASLGQWGRDVPGASDAAFVRQNLTLLVDGGAPVASASSPGAWGASVSGATTWRSALGIDAHGALVYAAGGGLTPATLAQALVAAGVQRAMELDINPSWVSFNTYQPALDGTVHGTKVYGLHADDRYLSPDSRDFIAMLVRAVVASGATGRIGTPALHATIAMPTT